MKKLFLAVVAVLVSMAPSFAQVPVDARSDDFVRQVHGANVRLGIDLVIKSVADSAKAALRAAEAAKKTAAGIRVPATLPAAIALQNAVDGYSRDVAYREADRDTLSEAYLQYKSTAGKRSLQLERAKRYFRDRENLMNDLAALVLQTRAELDSLKKGVVPGTPAAPPSTPSAAPRMGDRTAAAPTTGDYITVADANETFATKAEVRRGFGFVATGLRELEPAAKNKKTLNEAINGLIAVF